MRRQNKAHLQLSQLRAASQGVMLLPAGHPVRRFDEKCAALDERQRHVAFQLALHVVKRYPAFLVARPPAGAEHERAADLLVELAKLRGRFVRAPGDLSLSRKGVAPALRGLVEGVLCRWPVPAWAHNALLRPERNRDHLTVIARLGQGEPVRRVFREVPLTQRAAHLLTTAVPAELDVVPAVRFAQALAAGLDEDRARKLALVPELGQLWPPAEELFLARLLAWLAGRPAIVDEVQLPPLFAWARSRFRAEPGFDLKGRTARSVTRAVARFVDILEDAGAEPVVLSERFEVGELARDEHVVEAAGVSWRFVPIRTAAELMREAEAMKHCVFTYRDEALAGESRLFSLRRERGGGRKRALTIEVCDREITEVRGRCNRAARLEEAEVVRAWAAQLGLEIGCEVEV